MHFTINGQSYDAEPDIRTSVLDLCREHLGLTGSKKGCDHGQCGACTVLINGRRVNSCLTLACMHDGDEIVTIEGLGAPGALSAMQEEFLHHDGFQCGFCTPGFVCSMAAEYYRPSRAACSGDHEHGANGFDLHALSGNLCRCTGYRPIRDAAYALGEPAPNDAFSARSATPPPAPVVLLVEVEGVLVLLTGDVEPPAQAALERVLAGVEVDVLKVPHHGSRHQDLDLLLGVRARLALVSVGADNDYGHPSADLLAAFTATGAQVRRTDLDGDVLVTVDDGALGVRARD